MQAGPQTSGREARHWCIRHQRAASPVYAIDAGASAINGVCAKKKTQRRGIMSGYRWPKHKLTPEEKPEVTASRGPVRAAKAKIETRSNQHHQHPQATGCAATAQEKNSAAPGFHLESTARGVAPSDPALVQWRVKALSLARPGQRFGLGPVPEKCGGKCSDVPSSRGPGATPVVLTPVDLFLFFFFLPLTYPSASSPPPCVHACPCPAKAGPPTHDGAGPTSQPGCPAAPCNY